MVCYDHVGDVSQGDIHRHERFFARIPNAVLVRITVSNDADCPHFPALCGDGARQQQSNGKEQPQTNTCTLHHHIHTLKLGKGL